MQPIPAGNGATPRKKRNFSANGVDIRRNPAILKDITRDASPSSSGLGHRVLIPATWVRLPLEMPFLFSPQAFSREYVFFGLFSVLSHKSKLFLRLNRGPRKDLQFEIK